MSQTVFSMETFKIFSNLAFISNEGMLNQVIAVITAVLGHFDDHGNQLIRGNAQDFSSDGTLRVHQSDTSFVFLLHILRKIWAE